MSDIPLVREVLRDTTVVLVGGDRRLHHIRRIKAAFALSDVFWLSTRSSDPSARGFEAAIRRHDISLVVCLNGLVRHQHSHDLRQLCRDLRIPFVAGWRSPHPGPLAAAIVAQGAADLIRRRRCA